MTYMLYTVQQHPCMSAIPLPYPVHLLLPQLSFEKVRIVAEPPASFQKRHATSATPRFVLMIMTADGSPGTFISSMLEHLSNANDSCFVQHRSASCTRIQLQHRGNTCQQIPCWCRCPLGLPTPHGLLQNRWPSECFSAGKQQDRVRPVL